jgi:AAHS family 4-hydroxybenzoate transporter-like MFS transporter
MGAVAGAMAGGLMMSMGLKFGAVFTLLAVPAIAAACALVAISRRDVEIEVGGLNTIERT